MTYASKPYWWIVCDAPGCNDKTSDHSEYSAWSEPDGAHQDARDAGWAISQDDLKHYCDDHRRYMCGECDKSEDREYPLDQEGMCDECWDEDAKQNHRVRTAAP